MAISCGYRNRSASCGAIVVTSPACIGSHKRPKDASVSRQHAGRQRGAKAPIAPAADLALGRHRRDTRLARVLTAGGADRERLCRRYLFALEEEEQTAAAIKHTIDLIAKVNAEQDSIAPTHTPSARAANGTPRQGARAANRPGSE